MVHFVLDHVTLAGLYVWALNVEGPVPRAEAPDLCVPVSYIWRHAWRDWGGGGGDLAQGWADHQYCHLDG